MKRLPNDLAVLFAQYYLNRHNQYKIEIRGIGGEVIKAVLPGKKWDQDKDFNAIIMLANKKRYGVQASGGTFWLTKNSKSYEVNESSFPMMNKIKKEN